MPYIDSIKLEVDNDMYKSAFHNNSCGASNYNKTICCLCCFVNCLSHCYYDIHANKPRLQCTDYSLTTITFVALKEPSMHKGVSYYVSQNTIQIFFVLFITRILAQTGS